MEFRLTHTNMNVMDLEKSIDFYEKAFGMHVVRKKQAADGSYILAFLSDIEGNYQIELTWLRERKEPYDLSDNEIHIAFETPDMAAALAHHKEMGVVAFENEAMGIYFVEDPDGYWLEVVPDRKRGG